MITSPVVSITTPVEQHTLLPTQSRATQTTPTPTGQKVYSVENRVTEYICPKIVQVYSEDQLKAGDIPTSLFTDDVKSVIMFRGLEIGEPENSQTLQTYKDQGIATNDTRFEPDRNVTRAEFVKMLVRSLSCRYEYT